MLGGMVGRFWAERVAVFDFLGGKGACQMDTLPKERGLGLLQSWVYMRLRRLRNYRSAKEERGTSRGRGIQQAMPWALRCESAFLLLWISSG